jgi:hypothetical protein
MSPSLRRIAAAVAAAMEATRPSGAPPQGTAPAQAEES